MGTSGNEERMSPDVLNTTLMYKIVKKLSNIEKLLSEQIPLGQIYSIPNGVVITGDTYINFVTGIIIYPDNSKKSTPSFRRKLFSISIENEGTNNCTIIINPENTWGKRTINSGETFELDMKKAVLEEVKLSVTPTESCTVQISGVV